MEYSLYFKGLVIGFSIAAPVGPIGVLCIRRSLAGGRAYGFVSGLGAATADAFYGCVAGFGLTVISGFLVNHQVFLGLVGGIFLCWLGLRTFTAGPATESATSLGSGLPGAYASTFLLTLTNPMTILSFAAIFAGLGFTGAGGSYFLAALLVMGVFTGSAFWWLVLSHLAGALQSRFDAKSLQWVNRLSGLIIMAFGFIALSRALS